MMKDNISPIIDFLESIGINPFILGASMLGLLMYIFFRKDLKNWKNITFYKKSNIILLFYCIFLCIICYIIFKIKGGY